MNPLALQIQAHTLNGLDDVAVAAAGVEVDGIAIEATEATWTPSTGRKKLWVGITTKAGSSPGEKSASYLLALHGFANLTITTLYNTM